MFSARRDGDQAMGLLDFLKVTVHDKPAARKAKPSGPRTGSFLVVDNRKYPLVAIGPRGLAAAKFDGSLIVGQKAHVTIALDDEVCQLSFQTAVLVTDVKGDRVACEFSILPPETEKLLKQYAERKTKK
jgi:hypothetical protein